MPHEVKYKQIRSIVEVPGIDYDCAINLEVPEKSLQDILLRIWGDEDAWVLGHTTDGVLWGKIHNACMVSSYDANPTFGPVLSRATLLDLRIFNPLQELRIWKLGGELKACMVREKENESRCEAYDEFQIFLAARRHGKAEAEGVVFSCLQGSSGQTHAIPLDWDGGRYAWRLKVRHYLFPIESGMLTVTESRLLDICQKSEK